MMEKENSAEKLIFEGTVKSYMKQIFVLDEQDESVYGWIHKNTRDWIGKKVKITMEKLGP